MQPQVSAILRLLKEFDGKIPLNKVEAIFGRNLRPLIYRLRTSVFKIEDGYLKMDRTITDMSQEELRECAEDLIEIIEDSKKSFNVLMIVLAVIIGCVLGALFASFFTETAYYIDGDILKEITKEVFKNIQCLD